MATSPELHWVVARAFAPSGADAVRPDPTEALALAERLGLLERIVARHDLAALDSELGGGVTDRLRRERALAVARELQLDRALRDVARVAANLGVPLIVLKGRALVLAGYALPASRPSGDVDLLAPSEALEDLRDALLQEGFLDSGQPDSEHHLPALSHPSGTVVELHRHLRGVRFEGDRAADWNALSTARAVEPLRTELGFATIFAPGRDLLAAHALVHGLAQHGFHPGFRSWQLVGDLIDLAATAENVGPERPAWFEWIARDVSPEELGAALALARTVAAGDDPFAQTASDATRLAHHATAQMLDDAYCRALKARWLESPVSDAPRTLARLRLLLRSFSPPRRPGESSARRALRWLVRPGELAAKGLQAALAARRLGSRRRPSGAGAARDPGTGSVGTGSPRD